MPEGDTILRTATVLRRALAGRVVTGFELVAPRMTPAAARRQVVGGTDRSGAQPTGAPGADRSPDGVQLAPPS